MTIKEIKSKINTFRPTSHDIIIRDPNLKDESTRLLKFKDDGNNRFKIWVFTELIKLETSLSTSLLFSINYPDRVCFANKYFKEINGIGKIYTDNSKNDKILNCISLLENYLKMLEFDKNEGLSVYGNSLQLTLKQTRQFMPEIEICKKLKTIIELNFPDQVTLNDYSDLPKEFRKLLLKYKSFVITDDYERDEIIDELSIKKRKGFINEIDPIFDDINNFLEAFGDKPLTDSAEDLIPLMELLIILKNDEIQNHN